MYLESTDPERPVCTHMWIWARQQQPWQGVMQTRWLEVLSSDILLKLLPLWAIDGWASAVKWCFPPCTFHSSEPSPGASPLAANTELTPILQYLLAGGTNSFYKSLCCGALMWDKENLVQCPLLRSASWLMTCTQVPCLQIAHSFPLLQCPAWHEKRFNCTGK